MKMLFVHDHKFRRIDKDIYSPGGLSNEILSRYTDMFGEVVVSARIIEETTAKKTYSRIENPNVRITDSNDLYALAKEADCLVIRLPSIKGYIAEEIASKIGKPFLVEVVGCVWDSYWNYGIKGRIAAPFAYLLMKYEVKKSKYTLYVTQEFLQKRYPCKGLTIGVSDVELPSIDESVLNNRKNRIYQTKKKIIIGTIAAIDVPYKGHEYVIKALNSIREKLKVEVEYQMVGGGEKERLKKIASECNVENMVKFVGSLPHDKVFGWLDSIDYYIQPSLQEGLCRSLVEAMSRGLPCLASDVGGNFECITQDYIFTTANKKRIPSQISELLCRLVSNDKSVIEAEKNYLRAKEFFNKLVLEKRRSDFYGSFIKEFKD